MASDNEIIFHLGGKVTLKDFAKAVTACRNFIAAEQELAAKGVTIEWEIADLQPGSATLVLRGTAEETDQEVVPRVVRRAMDAATLYRRNRLSRLLPEERRPLDSLAGLVNGRIKEVRFHSSTEGESITRVATEQEEIQPSESVPAERAPQMGSVIGFVSTLSSQAAGLRFILKDRRSGRGVLCHFGPALKESARQVWDGLVRVEGLVRRDPQTGDAIAVYGVSGIEAVTPLGPGGFRKARGAIRHLVSAMSAEEAVRRVRDGQEG